MKSVCVFCFLTASLGYVQAQTADPSVATEWDVQKLLQSLALQAQHLTPVMDQVHPESWVSKGAPQTYVVQWKAAQAELKYLLNSSTAFSLQPDRLTLGLDTYFRMQAMESTLGSLIQGLQKYQSPDLARQLQLVVNENNTNRDHLRQYVQDLAAQKEQEFTIADREAQTCRAALFRQTSPKRSRVAR